MKNYISNKIIFVGVALTALVSASIYFVNNKHSALPANEPLTLRATTIEDNNKATTRLPPITEITDRENSTEATEQVAARPEPDVGFAMLEKSNRVTLTESELALPPPSRENVMVAATGEYADQITPQFILKKAKSEGYFPPEVAPDSHPPSGENVAFEPKGEYAHEVDQKALIDKARGEGYSLPEVAPGSHPPSGTNVTSKLQGENAHEGIGAKSL